MSYRIDPRLPLASEVRRIAAEEIEAATGHLAGVGDSPDNALHECRKRLKSLRALLRLIRPGDRKFAKAENRRYREVAAWLAAPRDAAALIGTIDRLTAEFPEEAASGELAPIRDRLVARRDALLDGRLSKTADAAAAACRTGLARFEKMNLPDRPEAAADILADGVRATMKRARRALDRARESGEATDFHDLRKAVKAHARHLSLMKGFWPSPVKPRLKALDALGERLGELHDICVLRALIKEEGRPLGSKAETRLLDRLARRSQRKLRKQCLTDASELFRVGPGRTARRIVRKLRRDLAGQQPGSGA
ncbi:MAG TPA: CHAD domain-containing protein [Rhizobiaceae bacterium]